MDIRTYSRLSTMSVALVACAIAYGQEGAFADYKQPDRDRIIFKTSFEGGGLNLPLGDVSPVCTSYGTASTYSPTGYYSVARGISSWPPDGVPSNNGSAGFVIQNFAVFGQVERQSPYYDINFMYRASLACPYKFRVDLYNSNGYISIGNGTNGGIVYLASANVWNRMFCRRKMDLTSPGGYLRPTEIRFVAIQDATNHYPAFGTYDSNAGLALDNVRVTEPARLSGMYKVTGGTNKDIGLFTFHSSGTSIGSVTNWIQTLGNVDIVNIFGREDLGNSTVSSNLLYTSLSSGIRQYTLTKLSTALDARLNSTWIGTGATGNPATDRYYGLANMYSAYNRASVFRQVTSSVYSHYIRNLRDYTPNTSEVPVNLGGEKIMAIADINGDGYDDFITKSAGKIRARAFTGFSGFGSSQNAVVSSPGTLSTYGNLTCYTVADFNNDGFDDLLLQDTNNGDVFVLVCAPWGSTLKWIFTLNSNEKLLAATDADNDGYPDIYCRRDVSGTVGNITIRKIGDTGQVVTTYDLLCQYANATYSPLAVGDINGDGSADITFIGNDAPNNSVYNALVDPATRHVLGQYWVCSARTTNLRPIYYYGNN